jgi:hypothetical protein
LVRALVVNRVRHPFGTEAAWPGLEQELRQALADASLGDVERLCEAARQELELASWDQSTAAALTREFSQAQVMTLPELALDVHDLQGLAQLSRALSGELTV